MYEAYLAQFITVFDQTLIPYPRCQGARFTNKETDFDPPHPEIIWLVSEVKIISWIYCNSHADFKKNVMRSTINKLVMFWLHYMAYILDFELINCNKHTDDQLNS